ncbi:MAG TPA: SDR family oxidoreductase [Pyrinomonadaceae bacterium]|jgi:NAD(P)-dependent dehydrogenase (short-subunit alcohol dehydrogenase family)
MSEQNKKLALITGANRGIGFETARQLGEQGIKVLIGARSEKNGREAAAKLKDEGFDAEFVLLDVDDAKTHESAAKYVEENYGRLDILINNAGIFIDQSEENGAHTGASKTSDEIFRKTFDTNFFNTVALTQKFLPLVKKSDAGRIVFLSSGLGSLNLHSDPQSPIYNWKVPAYDISKTALNGYAVHLAYELKDTPIKVNAAHPGSVLTDMNAQGELPVSEGAKTSVSLATLPADGYTGKFIHLGQELPW